MLLSFKEYRFSHGLVGEHVSAEALEYARKTYRKAYYKNYYQTQKKYKIQRRLTFTKKQDALVVEIAKRYGKTPSGFIRSCVLSYLGEPLPSCRELAKLLQQIRRIGNNINQITRNFHNQQTPFNPMLLFERLEVLENIITEHIQVQPNRGIRQQISKLFF